LPWYIRPDAPGAYTSIASMSPPRSHAWGSDVNTSVPYTDGSETPTVATGSGVVIGALPYVTLSIRKPLSVTGALAQGPACAQRAWNTSESTCRVPNGPPKGATFAPLLLSVLYR